MFEVAGLRVLITQSVFSSVGGSEVQALELARYLRSRGCIVTLYAWLAEYPLVDIIGDEGFELVTPDAGGADEMSADDFDIVWVQHECLPVELLGSVSHAEKVPLFIFVHLSPYREVYQEFPFSGDLEERCADAIAFNAQSTLEAQRVFFDSTDKLALYENPAPMEFIAAPAYSGCELKRLLVVSNHPPRELMQAAEMLRSQGIEVSYLSDVVEGALPRIISPTILEGFDCVVTIGKTVQDCLVMGIPVYVYDRFAGPGYLNGDNFAEASSFNFSGRCSDDGYSLLNAQERAAARRLSPSEIAHDIVHGHKGAVAFQREGRTELIDRYGIDACFDRLLSQAASYREAHGVPAISVAYAERMALLQRMTRDYLIAYRLVCLPEKYFYMQPIHLFENRESDSSFSEERSRYLDVRLTRELDVTVDVAGLAEVRLDPGERACMVADVSASGVNGQRVLMRVPSDMCIDGIHFFFHGDPQIVVSGCDGENLPDVLHICARVESLENISQDLIERIRTSTKETPLSERVLRFFRRSE